LTSVMWLFTSNNFDKGAYRCHKYADRSGETCWCIRRGFGGNWQQASAFAILAAPDINFDLPQRFQRFASCIRESVV
jgi:hypothetical protein